MTSHDALCHSKTVATTQLQLNRVLVVGANGSIGSAWIEHLLNTGAQQVIALSRRSNRSLHHPTAADHLHHWQADFDDESQIAACFDKIEQPLDAILVCTGVLHNDRLQPEKSLRQLDSQAFMEVIHTNTWIPMLIAKYGLTKLRRDRPSMFAALSARVGSIEDNRLGGWCSYRASKAALNMMIKCAAIEQKRRNEHCIVIGLHPGTVDSRLSQPFQNNVPSHKLFSPQQAVGYLSKVVMGLSSSDSGQVFAWDGQRIEA